MEVNEVMETPGWEGIRVQIDSGAIDTVGPKEIAKAFEMKETIMSKRGIGFAAVNGSGATKHGEKKIIGHTEDGEGVGLRIQRTAVEKALGSVHKMNVEGSVVVLGGERSYRQNQGDEQEDEDQL